ncbi:MAG TPA: phytanoyl-CoA dioxygenase family protein [Minicystis sp.]|nr:phytanoyl-CoA dioxygenase family protein [Minicystis sp.]
MQTEPVIPSPAANTLPAQNHKIEMPRFTLGERLTREQSEYLDTYGFVRFRGFLSKADLAAIVAEVEEIDRRLVREERSQIFGVPLLFGSRADGSRFVQRMVFASLFGERLHRMLKDPRFGGILAEAGPGYRIGERERDGLVINHYVTEAGSAFKKQGWHTDSLRDVFYLEKPRRYLNVGIYLDDSPIEKGGVRLIPFSHKQGLLPLLFRKRYYLDTQPDADEYAIVAEAGDLTIHDGRIWHRVAQASVTGDASRRRVMYVPLMDGPEKPKHDGSPTPFYFRLRRFAKF